MNKLIFLSIGLSIILTSLYAYLFFEIKNPFVRSTIRKITYAWDDIYIQKKTVRRYSDDKPIIFKGAVTDYFRNHSSNDIATLMSNTLVLKKKGATIIGLYLGNDYNDHTSVPFIKIKDLDKFVEFTHDQHLFIYFLPVAREFSESSDIYPKDQRLTELVRYLSQHYKNYNHILYGFGAEVEQGSGIMWDTWYERQTTLGKIVRTNNPHALLIGTGVEQYVLDGAVTKPLPFDNVIYLTGGYVGSDIRGLSTLTEESIKERIAGITYNYALNAPCIIGEFGGFYGDDFSSSEDLEIITQILEDISQKNLHFTAYTMDPGNVGLELFDNSNRLSKKGELVSRYLHQ